jgi:competence protein ComEC
MADEGRTPGGRRGYAGTWPPRDAAQAGGFVPAGLSWPPFLDALRQWARAEAGAGRLLPWVPVAFGTGIAFYFAANHEPVLPVAAATAIVLCAVALLLRRQKVFPVAVMIAAMAAGFAVATWKTARVAHGVLARPMFSVSLTGFVETRDIRQRTDRFVLRVATMESPRGDTKLERVRLSVRGHRARGRQFRRAEGTAAAAAGAVAAGLLRFQPRSVFPGDRRLRFCHRRYQDRRATRQRRRVVTLRRVHARLA